MNFFLKVTACKIGFTKLKIIVFQHPFHIFQIILKEMVKMAQSRQTKNFHNWIYFFVLLKLSVS